MSINLEEALKEFKIVFDCDDMSIKGTIYRKEKKIIINPLYGENIQTLLHEVFHYYYPDLVEDIIESKTSQYLKDNPEAREILRKYLP